MSRLAIFIDGGYVDALTKELNIRVDYSRFVNAIVATIASKTPDALDLLRTYYYDCLPYQSNHPTDAEARRFASKRRFFDALSYLERFEVRKGRLAHRGFDNQGEPIFQQKRTDLLLGLDFALLSGKNKITHAALVAGDSDFLPAIEVAKQEGIVVWLFHSGESTYARELWKAVDERFALDPDFMSRVARVRE